VLYQLSYAPRFNQADSSRGLGHHPAVGRIGPALLFCALTLLFAGIGIAAAGAEQWVIVVAAAALALWMGSFAWSALRRILK
jgi:hypothetical protein